MSYFFTLYLRAKVSELPWLIGAVLVGTMCTLCDEPLRAARSTGKRAATEHSGAAGADGDRRRHHRRGRAGRPARRAAPAPPADPDPPAQRDRVVGAGPDRRQSQPGRGVARRQRRGPRAVVVRRRAHRRAPRDGAVHAPRPADMPAATRAELADAVAQLAQGDPDTAHRTGFAQAAERAQRLLDQPSPPTPTRAGAPTGVGDRSTRRKRLPKSAHGSSGSRPGPQRGDSRRLRATSTSRKSSRGCGRRPGKPSRWPSPRRWPSSSAKWCRRRAGIGR